MPKRLTTMTVPDGEQTGHIEFASGQTFRLGLRSGNVIRFAVEMDDRHETAVERQVISEVIEPAIGDRLAAELTPLDAAGR